MNLVFFQSADRERFEISTNGSGVLSGEALETILHTEVYPSGSLTFNSNDFGHLHVDLSSMGVDDSWLVACCLIGGDPGFDTCVIGQPHWLGGVGDMHIFNFGSTFTTSTELKLRCFAVKVA